MSTERRSYAVDEGRVVALSRLPDGWDARYDGFERQWIAQSPTYQRDGVRVQGKTPEELAERVCALLARLV